MAVWAPAVMTSSSSLSYDVFATWSLNGGQGIQREISERNATRCWAWWRQGGQERTGRFVSHWCKADSWSHVRQQAHGEKGFKWEKWAKDSINNLQVIAWFYTPCQRHCGRCPLGFTLNTVEELSMEGGRGCFYRTTLAPFRTACWE